MGSIRLLPRSWQESHTQNGFLLCRYEVNHWPMTDQSRGAAIGKTLRMLSVSHKLIKHGTPAII